MFNLLGLYPRCGLAFRIVVATLR